SGSRTVAAAPAVVVLALARKRAHAPAVKPAHNFGFLRRPNFACGKRRAPRAARAPESTAIANAFGTLRRRFSRTAAPCANAWKGRVPGSNAPTHRAQAVRDWKPRVSTRRDRA